MITWTAGFNTLSAGLRQAGRITCEVTKATSLLVADAVIALSLRRVGRPRPGIRKNWPAGLREELYHQQGGRCVYCRVWLDSEPAGIDHMVPVNQGGANDPENLQLLCSPCNKRKSDRTDWQFRFRYAKLLPEEPRRPPLRGIAQGRFEAETQATEDHISYRRFKQGRYLTPAQKINSGVFVAGCVVAALVFTLLEVSIKPTDLLGPVLASLVLGTAASVGIRLRARYTGMDQEAD